MFARGENGKFIKGTQGGPGNEYAQRAKRFKALFYEAISEEEWVACIRVMLDKVLKDRNVRAFQELSDRCCGRPEQTFVDGTPEKPPITFEAFEKAMADLGYTKCQPSTSTTSQPSPSSGPLTPSSESTSVTQTTSDVPSVTPPPL